MENTLTNAVFSLATVWSPGSKIGNNSVTSVMTPSGTCYVQVNSQWPSSHEIGLWDAAPALQAKSRY